MAPDERFMRHHYGASGYVDPSKTVTLPDDVSVKMLQNEVAVLERRRDELLAALKALESCVVWSDTIQGYVLYQRVRDVLGPAREAIAKAEGQ